jgi:DNA-binding transcriptional MerR regulator
VDESDELPEKIFFKIGEVARIVGAEPYVLRYWEKEFGSIRPRKSRGGQRIYRRPDVELLLRIKTLLRDEGFTIAGARKKLAEERRGRSEPPGLKALDAPEDAGGASDEPTPEADEASSQVLKEEVDRLTQECQALRLARAAAIRRLAAAEEALRQVRREIAAMLDEIEKT